MLTLIYSFPCYCCLISLIILQLLILQVFGQVVIDNEIISAPQIQCRNKSIMFSVQTKNPFRGNIYVKGQYGMPRCRKEFHRNDYSSAAFEIAHGDCGMLKVRQLQPPGLGYTLEVMTSFHPRFLTKIDRGFNVHCFYTQTLRPVETELQVASLPSHQLDESAFTGPNCHYTIRSETVEGPIARTVEVGELIIHRWQCDNPNFGMLIKNCVVSDGSSSTDLVLDERGCPTKTSVIQSELTYDNLLTMAFAKVNAFSFPDRSLLNFRCQVQVCNKEENECIGVTPPNCPRISPQDYLPNSVVNPNANPTKVVGTFETPFRTSFLPGGANFLSNQQYPSQSFGTNPSFTPKNSFLFDPSKQSEPSGPFFKHSAALPRRNSFTESSILLNDNNLLQRQNSSAEMPALQVLNRPSKLSVTNPSEIFKRIPTDDITLTALQKTNTQWRAKRAEDKTLDVIADPVQILEFSNDKDEEIFKARSKKYSQSRPEIVLKAEEQKYCVNRFSLFSLITLLILLSCSCIAFAVYILNDFVIYRNKRRKEILTTNQDPFVTFDNASPTPNSYDIQRAQIGRLGFSFSRLQHH